MNDTDSSEHAVSGTGKWIAQIGIPLVVSVLVGIGSAAVIGSVLVVRLDERVATLERDVARHEAAMAKEIQRVDEAGVSLSKRADDQQVRVSLLESALDRIRNDVREIKADVKIMLQTSPPIPPQRHGGSR